MSAAWWLLALGLGLGIYTYAGYPLLLAFVARLRSVPLRSEYSAGNDLPSVTVTVPAYNEEHTIAATVEALLRLEYPADRLEILVVSDASTDRTDEIVSGYASAGVKLLRMAKRGGKTAAENAARRTARGDIVVNTDASVRVPPKSLEPLIAAFRDPTVGVASGRDVSVAATEEVENAVEGGYVGYEMWVRSLETRAGGIIGSSGCFFATRAGCIEEELPPNLSWDFAAPLLARERGYRAVSVPAAICYVPRTSSLRQEYRRKVRTIARGMQTLLYKRQLLNPLRYGGFAWMLFSHKVCRWLLPWGLLLAAAALTSLAAISLLARWTFLGGIGFAAVGLVGCFWPEDRPRPRFISMPAFLLAGNMAVLHAAIRALTGVGTPLWEPTRRPETALAAETSTQG